VSFLLSIAHHWLRQLWKQLQQVSRHRPLGGRHFLRPMTAKLTTRPPRRRHRGLSQQTRHSSHTERRTAMTQRLLQYREALASPMTRHAEAALDGDADAPSS
jgi:hypothetical protein